MNQTEESQTAANSQQRFSQRTELGSYSHHRQSLKNGSRHLDSHKSKDNSEPAKSSGSQSGLVKCQLESGEVAKASSNMRSRPTEGAVQKGLKRRETHDSHNLQHKLYRDKLLKLSDQISQGMELSPTPDRAFAAT